VHDAMEILERTEVTIVLFRKNSYQSGWLTFFTVIIFFYPAWTGSGMLLAQSIMSTDMDRVVNKASGILDGYKHQVHCLYIQDRFTISFWIVVPEINTHPKESEIPANCEIAIRKALYFSQKLLEEIPEIRNIFDSINPMIADASCATWYMDFIPVRDLPADFQAFTRFHDMDTAYIRRSVPVEKRLADLDDAIKNVCLYLDKELPSSHPAAYLIIEESKPYMQIYFAKHTAVKELADLFPIIRQSCFFLAGIIPKIDKIELFCLASNRRLQVYSTVSCSGLIPNGKNDNLIAHTNFYKVNDSAKSP
jgi:hypothetical protein